MNKEIICSIVLNSVSRDARVLKQAQSLSNAGYQITILGVKDEKFNLSSEELANGLVVRRLDLGLLRKAAMYFVKSFFLLLFALSIYFLATLTQFSESIIVLVLVLPSIIGSFFYLLRSTSRFKEASKENSTSSNSVGIGAGKITRLLKSMVSPILKLSWTFLKWASFIKMLWKIKPNIVHCHDIHTLPIGVVAKLIFRCKLVYDAHEIYEEVPQVLIENGARLKLFKRIHKISQHFVDHFITINESNSKWYAENYPKFPESTVIMNATVLAPLTVYDGRLHRAANLKAETKILLYQGGFSEHRGLDFLVRSAEHLPINWVLVMMGWGKYEEHLKNIAVMVNEQAKLAGRFDDAVRFIPPAPQSELTLWTAGGSIGVIPYENTGLNHWFCTPNKMWEFPNASLPVLVSPFPELRKPVDQYANGWLLPEKDDEHFIGDLIRSLSPEELEYSKQNTRKFIEKDNWSIYEQRLIHLYEEISNRTS